MDLLLGYDVTIVDPQAQWEVDPSRFRSKSRNTPFAGWKVKGQVTTTIVTKPTPAIPAVSNTNLRSTFTRKFIAVFHRAGDG